VEARVQPIDHGFRLGLGQQGREGIRRGQETDERGMHPLESFKQGGEASALEIQFGVLGNKRGAFGRGMRGE